MTFDDAGVILRRIEGGEKVDFVMIPRADLQTPDSGGKVSAAFGRRCCKLARGRSYPPRRAETRISSPEAFKRALLNARSVARPDPTKSGSRGVHIAKVLERLGIAEALESKSVIASRPEDSRDMPGYKVC